MTNVTTALNTHTQMASCRLSTTPGDVATGWTYYNGDSNDGLGATIKLSGALFSMDGNSVNLGDRVLVGFPTAPNNIMNGIYLCTQVYTGSPLFLPSILTRAGDMQCKAQLLAGSFSLITEGVINAGAYGMVRGPLPDILGVSALYFSYTNSITTSLSNRQVLTGDLTLIYSSPTYQFLDPGAANRDVTLPVGVQDLAFYIKNINTALFTLTIQDADLNQVGPILANGVGSGYYFDGTVWQTI
jgi:hypothetical protein